MTAEHLRAQWRRRIAAHRYTFDVDYSEDKDVLKTGETVSGTRRVIVEADTMSEGALIAEQMVAARGWEPTECRAVDWTDGP